MAAAHDDPVWWEPYGSAVRDAAPDVPHLSPDERDALWQQVRSTTPRPRGPRVRWKVVVAGLVAALAVGGAGVATASVLGAHTGRGPVDAEDVELGGPGERLDPRAPDFAAVVDETTTDIRFPSAPSRDRALAWEVDDLSSDPEPAIVSTGALRLWTSGHALCAWSNTWAVALRAGDDVAAERAAGVILRARTWSSIRDTDPDLADQSEFAWLPDLERAVREGDTSAARDALQTDGSCLPGLAPELGLGER